MKAYSLHYRRLDGMELTEILREPKEAIPMMRTVGEHDIAIGDTWHALHFLLTGDAADGDGPLADVVLGGFPLLDADTGLGPPRVLTPARVAAAATALAAIDFEDLARRFDPKTLDAASIHPGDWELITADAVADAARRVTRFFAEVADAGDAVVVLLRQ